MSQELRIPFSDFEYNEHGKTPIYIEKVEGCWGAYMPRPKCSMTFNAERGVELKEFVDEIKSFLEDSKIDYVFRCCPQSISNIIKNQFIIRKLKNGRGQIDR